jgi:hypothetical protein
MDDITGRSIMEEFGAVIRDQTGQPYRFVSRVLRHFELPLIDDSGREGLGWRRGGRAIKPPPDIFLVAVNLLLPLLPQCHLRELVFEVSGTICVLGEVDVQTFRVFRVTVVRRAEEFYIHNILVLP